MSVVQVYVLVQQLLNVCGGGPQSAQQVWEFSTPLHEPSPQYVVVSSIGVGVGVAVGVEAGVGVRVGVGLWVGVGVRVGVKVGVAVGVVQSGLERRHCAVHPQAPYAAG